MAISTVCFKCRASRCWDRRYV